MAPMIKRPAANGVSKVHRKKSIPSKAPAVHISEDEDDDNDLQDDQPDTDMNGHVQQSVEHLSDLRTMADRVGREVDTFAETLDKFNDQLRANPYEGAHSLCLSFKDIATENVRQLRKKYEIQKTHDTFDGFRQRSTRSMMSKSTADGLPEGPEALQAGRESLKQWEAEADTWELFRVMLELRYMPQEERAKEREQAFHRYTGPKELWDRFLIDNDKARERHAVVKWLEQSTDHGDTDLDDRIKELEKQAGRDGGVWANGWMETREKIKGAKRLRIGDGPLQDIKRTDSNDLLVSHLDPDSVARETRTLEKADVLSEKVMWMTCWDMLRKGKSWSYIREWCLDRNQGWRAASMGLAGEIDIGVVGGGANAGSLFRRACYVAAKSGSADIYEAAVYGLLSGDLEAPLKVCKTWDDHLYAYYRGLVTSQFDKYAMQHQPDRLSTSFTQMFTVPDISQQQNLSASSANDIVSRLAQRSALSREVGLPIKQIQAGLIADTMQKLCSRVGVAVGNAADKASRTTAIQPVQSSLGAGESSDLSGKAFVGDFNALRILTHMLVVLRNIDTNLSQATDSDAMDNVIAVYIEYLRATGQRDLTPEYASMMSPRRSVLSMALVLRDITEPSESLDFVRLLEIYGIDAIAVIKGRSMSLLTETIQRSGNKSFSMLEQTNDELCPGQRIRLNFPSDKPSELDQSLVDGLSIFHLIEGQWTATFESLGYACRQLLVHGHYTAASQLVRSLQFDQLSLEKSRMVFGHAVNVADPEQTASMLADPSQAAQVMLLQKQSQIYHSLTSLVRAIEALQHWRAVEHEYLIKLPRPTSIPVKLKRACTDVTIAVAPLLSGFLQDAADEEEAADLAAIRTLYIPEVVLAYNTVLCSAGHLISREELLASMDLSTVIADEQSGLGAAFVEAGRMRELVKAFAETSKIMLKLNETGKPRKEKKAGMGRSLAIWEING